jgi:hypothetical protein
MRNRLLDVGHPLKTTCKDLSMMLESQGFAGIKCYSCPQMIVRSVLIDLPSFKIELSRRLTHYMKIIRPLKIVLSGVIEKMMISDVMGWRLLLKLLIRAEKMVFCDASGPAIANFARDYLIVAVKK